MGFTHAVTMAGGGGSRIYDAAVAERAEPDEPDEPDDRSERASLFAAIDKQRGFSRTHANAWSVTR